MATIVGCFRVGRDPEYFAAEGNKNARLVFTVADADDNPRYKDDDRNRHNPKTLWYDVTLWGKQAETYAEGRMKIVKGDLLEISGQLGLDAMLDQGNPVQGTTQKGNSYSVTKLTFSNVYSLRKRNDRKMEGEGSAREATVERAPSQEREPAAAASGGSKKGFESDIPF